MEEIHSWKVCRAGGCGNCCTCDDNCTHQSYMTTFEEFIELLQKYPPKARLVIEKEHHMKYVEIAGPSRIALKHNTLEHVYHESQPDGTLAPPEGAEEAYALCLFE